MQFRMGARRVLLCVIARPLRGVIARARAVGSFGQNGIAEPEKIYPTACSRRLRLECRYSFDFVSQFALCMLSVISALHSSPDLGAIAEQLLRRSPIA